MTFLAITSAKWTLQQNIWMSRLWSWVEAAFRWVPQGETSVILFRKKPYSLGIKIKKRTRFIVIEPGHRSWFCHLLAIWHWTNHFSFQSSHVSRAMLFSRTFHDHGNVLQRTVEDDIAMWLVSANTTEFIIVFSPTLEQWPPRIALNIRKDMFSTEVFVITWKALWCPLKNPTATRFFAATWMPSTCETELSDVCTPGPGMEIGRENVFNF